MGISQKTSVTAEHQNNRREWQPGNSLLSFKETLQWRLDSRARPLEELPGESQGQPAGTLWRGQPSPHSSWLEQQPWRARYRVEPS